VGGLKLDDAASKKAQAYPKIKYVEVGPEEEED
jgi:hypothetical protein